MCVGYCSVAQLFLVLCCERGAWPPISEHFERYTQTIKAFVLATDEAQHACRFWPWQASSATLCMVMTLWLGMDSWEATSTALLMLLSVVLLAWLSGKQQVLGLGCLDAFVVVLPTTSYSCQHVQSWQFHWAHQDTRLLLHDLLVTAGVGTHSLKQVCTAVTLPV